MSIFDQAKREIELLEEELATAETEKERQSILCAIRDIERETDEEAGW